MKINKTNAHNIDALRKLRKLNPYSNFPLRKAIKYNIPIRTIDELVFPTATFNIFSVETM